MSDLGKETSMLRVVTVTVLVLAGSFTAFAAPKSTRDGWPETKAGVRARGWVEAFSAGEDSMRAFLKQNVADQSLVDRNVPKRIESYRKMRERFGILVLGSVEESEPYKLTVSLLAEDASVQKFV